MEGERGQGGREDREGGRTLKERGHGGQRGEEY